MKTQNIKAALFDLDGVVVFTDKYHYLAWKRISDEMGWSFDEKVNNRLRGISRMASLDEILKHNNIDLSIDKKIELANRKNEYYIESLNELNETDMFDGAVEFIRELKARNVKICLCSSSKNALFVLEKLGIDDLFDEIVTGNDIKLSKPDPEIFLTGAKKVGVPAFHCVVFEDSSAGIEAAQRAKMRTVGVGNADETAKIADQFIKDYSEIDIDLFIKCGRKKRYPISETSFIETDIDLNDIRHIESMFSLGNGYLGMRGTYDEYEEFPQIAGMYINGIYATEKYNHLVEFKGFAQEDQCTVNLPDWRIFNLYVDGEKASYKNDNIVDHRRELDFVTGTLKRRFIFETKTGKRLRVESIRFLSMNEVHSANIRFIVSPLNFSGKITVESVVIKDVKTNGKNYIKPVETFDEECFTEKLIVPSTNQTVFISVAHNVAADSYSVENKQNEQLYSYTINADVQQNKKLVIDKFAAFSSSMDNFSSMEFTKKLALKNKCQGFDLLLEDQIDFWNDYWKTADIKIKGNSADQQAVRFSLFQLKQQLPSINQCSIGATGLTGPKYSGKVFWDTEMYLMPYYNYTLPYSQKELLMYRYKTLENAKKLAQTFDAPGAMYAWATINGDETSVVYEASTAEIHLNSDIAFAVWRYVDSTNDKDFLYDYGAEIVFETAKYMSWRGSFSDAKDGKFSLNAVCGPDEYNCGVSNNLYTNMMLRFHLKYAIEIAEEMRDKAANKFEHLCTKIGLDKTDFELWRKIAENIYIGYNEKIGVYEQDDSFLYRDPIDMNSIPMNNDIRDLFHPLDLWRYQVSKQADVVLINFILGNEFTGDEKLRCYNYYEPKCNHGSSLSSAIHCIMASELKKPEAYEFFESTAYMDIYDFKKNTSGGLHLACLGGVWMSVVNGFLGFRHYKNGVSFSPNIPDSWSEIECSFVYKNNHIKIEADKKSAKFSLLSGEGLSFNVYNTEISLSRNNSVIDCIKG